MVVKAIVRLGNAERELGEVWKAEEGCWMLQES